MTQSQTLTRDGTPWTPTYLEEIDAETCIGCGRCFKVCTHSVLEMKAFSEDGDLVDADDGDAERMVMTIADGGKCIGCGSCGRVCGSKSMKFLPANAA
jgi:Nif-specific ferredoxin III